jgi:hypothetical protein
MNNHGYPQEEEELRFLRELPTSDFEKNSKVIISMFENTGYGKGWIEKIIDDFGDSIWELRLVTGGWSGCEDMIGELRENYLWWGMFWYSIHRGGLFVFRSHKEM